MIPCSSLLVCGFGEGTGILPWSRGGFENGRQLAGSAREWKARRYPAISVVAGGRTGPVSEAGRHPGVAGLLRGPPSFQQWEGQRGPFKIRLFLCVAKPSTVLGKADGPTHIPRTHPPEHQPARTPCIHSRGRTLKFRGLDSHIAARGLRTRPPRTREPSWPGTFDELGQPPIQRAHRLETALTHLR